MAKRDEAAASKGRATRARTPAEAGRANLAKGRAKKREQAERAAQEGRTTAGERWAMLLSGTLRVEDLDDEEIARMRVRGADGTFGGRRQRIPSHLAQQMQREAIKRANEQFRTAAPAAVKRLLEIANDPDTKDADAIRALDIVLNRGLGKTPDVLRVEGASAFDALTAAAVGLDRDLDGAPVDASGLAYDDADEAGTS